MQAPLPVCHFWPFLTPIPLPNLTFSGRLWLAFGSVGSLREIIPYLLSPSTCQLYCCQIYHLEIFATLTEQAVLHVALNLDLWSTSKLSWP